MTDILGTSANELLAGTSGDDTITTGGGRDTVQAGDGNDLVILDGPLSASSNLDGGTGSDTLRVTLAAATVLNGNLFVQLNSSTVTGFETLEFASQAGETLRVLATFNELAQFSALTGGAGTDVFSIIATAPGTYTLKSLALSNWSSTDIVALNAANNGAYNLIAAAHDGIYALNGASFNDTLTGSTGSEILNGNAGNDDISGDAGNDTLNGGAGADTLEGGAGDDVLSGGTEADQFGISLGHDTVTDFLVGTDKIDVSGANFTSFAQLAPYLSQVGADAVFSYLYDGVTNTLTLQGVNAASLSAGDFVFADPNGTATLPGTDNADVLLGLNGGDTISGLGGNDLIYGYGGADSLDGGAGNDTLSGGAGDDTLVGGADVDTADYSDTTQGVTVNLLLGTVSGSESGTDTLLSIENVVGGSGNDSLTGDGNANSLTGGDGNDTLTSGGGVDTLLGGNGNDLLILDGPLGGGTTLAGGSGTDTLRFTTAAGSLPAGGLNFVPLTNTGLSGVEVLQFGSQAGETLRALISIGQLAEVTTLSGGAGTDVLTVTAGAPGNYTLKAFTLTSWDSTDLVVLSGAGNGSYTLSAQDHAGTYVLSGGAFGDVLTGSDGAEVLNGNGGNDNLDGGAGNDTLNGGDGADTLAGGAGDDLLTGGNGADQFGVSLGHDTVTDFVVGTDRIDVSGANFTSFVQLAPYFSQVGPDAVFSYLYNGVTNTLTLQNVNIAALSATDFVFADPNGTDVLPGTDDADVLLGREGNDTIDGGAGNDLIYGYGGNDLLTGGAGSDQIDGGAGTDTAVFSGVAANYTVTHNGDGSVTVAQVGTDGSDRLVGVEYLQFADTTLPANHAPALTGAQPGLAAGISDTPYTASAASLLAGFSDADGDALAVAGLSADHGTVTDNGNGTFTIVPASGYAGTVTLSYNVVDGQGGSTAASESFNLTGPTQLAPGLTRTDFLGPNGNVAAGDIDHDGDIDLVSANWNNGYDGTITIWKNDGSGHFTKGATYASPFAADLRVADISSDGNADVVVVQTYTNTVGVFLGDGTGNFTHQANVPTGSTTIAVQLADVNGDQYLDLVSTSYYDAQVSVSFGDGHGNFAPRTTYNVGPIPYAVAVADFNEDTFPDIIAPSADTGQVFLLTGSANGTFTQFGTFNAPPGSLFSAVADFGNGHQDIVLDSRDTNTITVLIGDGTGQFQATSYAVGSAPFGVQVGDFNGDGRLDIVSANGGDGTVSLLLGNGDGTFLSAQSIPSLPGASTVTVADLNGDGRDDIAVGSGQGMSLIYNTAFPDRLQIDFATDSGTPGDFKTSFSQVRIDGSGVPDAQVTLYEGGVLVGQGTADAAGAFSIVTSSLARGVHSITAVATDANGHSSIPSAAMTVEVVAPAASGPNASITLVDPATTNADVVHYLVTFTEPTAGVTAQDFTLTASGLAGAGILSVDGVAVSGGTQYSVAVSTGTGSGTLSLALADNLVVASTPSTNGSTPTIGDIGDVNGDGKADLVLPNYYSGTVGVLLGHGDGTFDSAATFQSSYEGPFNSNEVRLGDINGDGKLDLVATNWSEQALSAMLGNGDGTFQPRIYTGIGDGLGGLQLIDFNRDGKLDAVFGQANGYVGVALGDGTGHFGSWYNVGQDGMQAFAYADVTGDGSPELVIKYGAQIEIDSLDATGDTQVLAVIDIGATIGSQTLLAADVNGDGLNDLIMNDYAGSRIGVMLNTGGGSFDLAAFFAFAAANPINIAVSDANGDGKPDVIGTGEGGSAILFGNGDGTFSGSQVFDTGTANRGTFGDVNGDGMLDLVAANYFTSQVTTLLGAAADSTSYTIARNHAPTAENGTLSATEDTPVEGSVTATDADSDPLTYAVVAQPLHGVLDFNTSDGTYQYTPDADYNGADGFSWKANDGAADSNVGTVAITVAPVNDPSLADAQSLSGSEDTPVTGQLTGSDVDGDTLTFAVVDGPQHGTLDLAADGSFTYTPEPNWSGDDSFSFTSSDGTLTSTAAQVSLGIAPVNDAPVAEAGSTSGPQGTTITGQVQASDAEFDALTYAVGTGPVHGTLTFNSDGTFEYTPNAGFAGTDEFTFVANDGQSDSAPATFSLTVEQANRPPSIVLDFNTETVANGLPGVVYGASGDFNCDGKLDAFVTDGWGIAEGHILLGNGDGTFSVSAPIFDGPGAARTVYAVDVNGDQKLDLIFGNSNAGSVGVALGNGDGTFGAVASYSAGISAYAGSGPQYVTFGDVNHDNHLDMITGGADASAVLLGNGDGTFAAPTVISGLSGRVNIVGLADFNGDGNLDLAADDNSNTRLSILAGDGNGGFTPLSAYDMPAGGFVIADFNHDAIQDIAWATGDRLLIEQGNGDGTFTQTFDLPKAAGLADIQVGDIDGDGNLDVVTSNTQTATLSVFLGRGDGSFQSELVLGTGQGNSSSLFGDFDVDGDVDFLITNSEESSVTLLRQTTAGSATEDGATISGQLHATDPDAGAVLNWSLDGAVSGLTLNADGSWTFNASGPAYQYLAAGEKLHLSAAYTVSDEFGMTASSVLPITVTGTNDAPRLAPTPDGQRIFDFNTQYPMTLSGGAYHFTDGSYRFDGIRSDANEGIAYIYRPDGNVGGGADGEFRTADGSEFSLVGFLVKDTPIYPSANATFEIYGIRDGGVVASRTVHYSTSAQYLTFDAAWSNVDDVRIFLTSATADQYMMIDNLQVTKPDLVVNELANTTGHTAPDGAALQMTFADVDLADTHTASARVVTSSWTGGTLSAAQLASLQQALSLDLGDSTGSGSGTVTVRLPDAALDFLAAGQALTVTYDITVTDRAGAASTQRITIAANGTNDAPVVTAQTATLSEDAAPWVFNALATASDPDSGAVLSVVNVPESLPAGVTWNAATKTFALDPANATYQALHEGESVTVTVNYSVSDGTVTTPTSVSWTVTGANDVAVITGTSTGSVTEAGGVANATPGTPTTSGVLTTVDPDAGESLLIAQTSLAGTYGDFAFNGAAWAYTLDNSRTATQALTAGQVVTDVLLLQSVDGTASRTVTVTITGANDAAVIGGATSGSVTEAATQGATSQVSGALTISDVDGPAQFVAGSLAGTYGILTLTAAGAWTYVLDNTNATVDGLSAGQTLSDTITVSAADGTTRAIAITINGTNDIRTGTNAADPLPGTSGNDSISGSGGNDTLTGGLGNDTLDGGNGTDTASYLDAGALVGATSGVTVNLSLAGPQNTGGAGTDTLTNIENLTGSNFADMLTGSTGANLLSGMGGNDTLDGGAGNDTLDGGTGTDTASYLSATGAVTVSLANITSQNTGGAGSDTLISIENLTGSSFNDTLTGDGNANVLDGGQGNDTLDGGLGNDTLIGGSGVDTATYAAATAAVTVNLAAGTATGGAGSDALSQIENVIGSAFADTLTGDGGANALSGGAGDDTLDGGLGDDTLDGGTGTDTVTYAASTVGVTVNLSLTTAQVTGMGTDTLTNIENLIGSAFNDTLTGSTAANRIDAGGGNDSVLGGAGNDTIDGNTGNDTMDGGAGDDLLTGGSGVDLLTYASAAGAVTVSLAVTAAQNTGGAGIDTLSGFENLTGSGFNDTLTGDGLANAISGGAGNDTIDGGLGNDTLDGGAGTDTATYASAASAVAVNLATGQATGGAGTDTLTGFEALVGSAFADTLTGDANANTLDGGSGDDTLDGGAGNDTIIGGLGTDTLTYASASAAITVSLALTTAQATGGSGSDQISGIENLIGSAFADRLTGSSADNVLDGGAGNDTLDGGLGNDRLIGGAGADRLTGGGGADTFVFALATDSAPGSVDLITDFVKGTDKVDLTGIDAIPGGNHNAFAWGGTTPTGRGLWYAYDAAANVTHLYGDTNNSTGTVEFQLDFTGNIAFTQADFLL